jgi:hypothetical protein
MRRNNRERRALRAARSRVARALLDPRTENAAKRRRNASKAATAKADREIRETKAEIRDLVRLVREEDFDVSKANAMNRLFQTMLQYIIVERGIYREDDLAQRIRELSGK